jgi:Ca2+-binding RTX toxin-like protein
MAFLGSDFLINSTTAGEQDFSTQTLLSDGRILVVWASYEGSNDGGQANAIDVRGRILEADGTPTGSDFLIDTTRDGDQSYPTVTALPDGGAFVAWQSYIPSAGEYDVRGRIIHADGSTAGPDFIANADTFGAQYGPSATTLADGHVLITFNAYDVVDPDRFSYPVDVEGRILSADGTGASADFLVNTTLYGNQYGASPIALPDGRAFVTWTSYNPDGGIYDVYARFLGADGSPSAPDFVVEADQPGANPTLLADGRILLTWTSGDVRAQILTIDGAPDGPAFTVNSTVQDGDMLATAAALPDGGAFVVWVSYEIGSGYDLYGRVINADGTMSASDFIVNSATGMTEFYPHVTALDDGRVLVTWTSSDSTSNSGDIHGRVLSFDNTVDGTPMGDILTGTNGNDVINGYGGNDVVFAGAGNDVLHGGDGNDALTAGAGNDYLHGGAGSDQMWGNAGNDTFDGGPGADQFAGGAGVDTVRYDGSAVGVHIDLTQNLASGGEATGDMFNSIETIVGSRFDDTITGDAASNNLFGGVGNDVLYGLDGADVLSGGDGWDALTGGSGDDVLRGGAGNDQIWGNAGNDILDGGGGGDVLAGGAGLDTADYSTSAAAVSIDLAAGTGQGGDAEGDTLSSIEDLIGSAFNDTLIGNSAGNHLVGGAGDDVLDGAANNDTLEGGAGNDILIGGAGTDLMYGGEGSDTFAFKSIQDSLPAAPDIIVDFSPAEEDRIDLSAIDANSNIGGVQDFVYIGAAEFDHVAGELRYADHLLQGDIDGNGVADFVIQLNLAPRAEDLIP